MNQFKQLILRVPHRDRQFSKKNKAGVYKQCFGHWGIEGTRYKCDTVAKNVDSQKWLEELSAWALKQRKVG